jgi:hypothetical protein
LCFACVGEQGAELPDWALDAALIVVLGCCLGIPLLAKAGVIGGGGGRGKGRRGR